MRKYTQILFQDGTSEDRLNIIKNLRRKVALKDKVIYFDSSFES